MCRTSPCSDSCEVPTRPRLALGVVEALALQQQGGPLPLEPGFEHGPLGQYELRLGPAGINELINHRAIMPLRMSPGRRPAPVTQPVVAATHGYRRT